jgi:hypothetical protein
VILRDALEAAVPEAFIVPVRADPEDARASDDLDADHAPEAPEQPDPAEEPRPAE